MARIAVIIVNYNAAELAIAAVESVLAREHRGHDVSIHVVDNASPESGAERLNGAATAAQWNGQVTLHLEKVNHGFGRGNNIVLKALAESPTPPDYVLLLNPDAQLHNETISILADFLDSHPAVGVVGARAYNPGNPHPVTAAFRFPNLGDVFSSAVNFGPVARLFERHQVALAADLPTQKVDWVSGAAAMARFGVWKDLDFFDPEYFLYYEEVDLMRRTADAGWECWHVAEAEILHIEGASTDVRSADAGQKRRPAYWYHSWQYYFRKNHGRGYALAAALAWTSGAMINSILARLRGQQPVAPKRFLTDFWATGIRPLLGLSPRRRT